MKPNNTHTLTKQEKKNNNQMAIVKCVNWTNRYRFCFALLNFVLLDLVQWESKILIYNNNRIISICLKSAEQKRVWCLILCFSESFLFWFFRSLICYEVIHFNIIVYDKWNQRFYSLIECFCNSSRCAQFLYRFRQI